MSFKLIAIRPGNECSNRFLKNLIPNQIYQFYNNYEFLLSEEYEGNRAVKSIILKDEFKNFFNIDGKSTEVNISAIVGKNGSGKSSLLELLYASCYVIASRKEILYGVGKILRKFRLNDQRMSDNDVRYLNEIQGVFRDLDVQIFYSLDDKIFMLEINQDYITHKILDGKDENFDEDGIFKNENQTSEFERYVFNKLFFYTISINYSVYGLNENFMGSWVKDLFHKNDGYQTPLVVNPFREEGNIDVNNELHLAQTRLMSNLLDNPFIVNRKKVSEIIFELDIDGQNLENTDQFESDFTNFKEAFGFSSENFVTNVYNGIFRGRNLRPVLITRQNNVYFEIISKYIFRKLLKISRNYKEYNGFVSSSSRIQFFKFILFLNSDRSHITLKLRQVLNILRFNILHEDDGHSWIAEEDYYKKTFNKYYRISLEILLEKLISLSENHPEFDIEELLPIGFFVPHILVQNTDHPESLSNIDELSSGEQHYIHTLHAIFYHIKNLNSVFYSSADKIKYQYINIVLDEIELFFHPEFQRKFISDLLDGFAKINIGNIRGVNILLATHSSFILSDIPHTNILKMDEGAQQFYNEDDKTFGANIHELLDNDFFLKDGFMGEFAKKKIKNLSEFLTRKEIRTDKWNKENSLKFIELIGEPLLRMTMKELYFKKYKNQIDLEIEKLMKIKENNGFD